MITEFKEISCIEKCGCSSEKRWIVYTKELIDYLKNNSFGYREHGANLIDGDELISILQKQIQEKGGNYDMG